LSGRKSITVRDGKITLLDGYDDRSKALEAAGLSEVRGED
jgi:hypothetical protein